MKQLTTEEMQLATLKQKEKNLVAKIARIPKEFNKESQPEALARAEAGLKEVRDAIRANNKENK